ncbi:MAG: diguanylate cyclase [Deltaproteobacteria bacterium]|nr:diguanylate cyclase [Deltaproteobacteria bacterium]
MGDVIEHGSSENDDSVMIEQAAAPKIDLLALTNQLEDQQKIIGSLQAQLHHFENKAASLDNMVFQMRSLLQSGKGFSEIMNLAALLDAFMAVCRERYASINSSVLLLDDLDPEDIFYRVRGYYGLNDIFQDPHGIEEEMYLFKIPHNQGLLWQLIHQGDVFAVRDMRKLPRFETAFRKWNLGVLDSDVWVPLMRGSNVLGILTLGECEDGSQIAESDYAFLEEIAAVAATNIDSTLKYEKNARILNNLRTLYDVNQQLANVNDFKQLTIETLSTAVEALKAQKANLMLYNPETERLEIKVVWGNIPAHTRDAINEGRLDTKSFAIGEGVAGLAAKTREPVRVNDRAKIEQVGRNTVYCILAVPLIYGGEVRGVMTLTNKVKEGDDGRLELDTLSRFGEDDEQLLLSLADQAAANMNKAKLYNASITDRLTGLNNARHFESRFGQLVEQSHEEGSPLCLAVTDIDHFKKFNDTYGHKAGDFVLQETAKLLGKMVREDSMDQCFRYGGEEFCMVLPDTEMSDAVRVLEDYRKQIESAKFDWDGQELKVSVSIGLADSIQFKHSISLFEAADKALYASKDNGRNQVQFVKDGSPKPIDAS